MRDTTTKAYAMSNQSPRNCDLLRSLGRPETWPLLVSARVFLEKTLEPVGKNAGKKSSRRVLTGSRNRRSFRYRSDQRGSFNHCTTQVVTLDLRTRTSTDAITVPMSAPSLSWHHVAMHVLGAQKLYHDHLSRASAMVFHP